MENESKNERYLIPNVEKTIAVIELMAREPNSIGVTEIANKLGYTKNSVFRIIKTLDKHGYVIEQRLKYILSPKILSVGYQNLGEVNLVEKSIDIMRELRNETKETTLLGTVSGLEGVVLEQVLGSYDIKFAITVGHKWYLHTGAPGKAMLAFMPEKEREQILSSIEYVRFNDRTINNKQEMEAELRDVRQKGYAFDRAERIEGLYGVSSPIINYLNYPVAGIWVTGPSFRMPESELDRIGETVKKYAAQISQRLGHLESQK